LFFARAGAHFSPFFQSDRSVFLCPGFSLYLVDFGLFLSRRPPRERSLTRFGFTCSSFALFCPFRRYFFNPGLAVWLVLRSGLNSRGSFASSLLPVVGRYTVVCFRFLLWSLPAFQGGHCIPALTIARRLCFPWFAKLFLPLASRSRCGSCFRQPGVNCHCFLLDPVHVGPTGPCVFFVILEDDVQTFRPPFFHVSESILFGSPIALADPPTGDPPISTR